MLNKKNIVVKVSPDFHKNVKMYVTMHNTTFTEYITNLIKSDMEKSGVKITE